MSVDLKSLRRHSADLSDEALAEIDRNDLVDAARQCYDEELGRRQPAAEPEPEPAAPAVATEERVAAAGTDGEPAWLPDAAVACAFVVHRGMPYCEQAANACAVLDGAGIPCHVRVQEQDEESKNSLYEVLVPGALALHATSILDRDLYNAQQEEAWRVHLAQLSNEDFQMLDPDIFCAGWLDRAERLTRAYNEELMRRKKALTPPAE